MKHTDHDTMKRRARILCRLLLTTMIPTVAAPCGCASAPEPRLQMERDVRTSVGRFVDDVRNDRADEVYSSMADNWQMQFTKDEFRSFFRQNKDAFVEYAEMLEADSESLAVTGFVHGDPCGNTSWVLTKDGQWKLARRAVAVDPEGVRARLLQEIRMRPFMEALDAYGQANPQWSGQKLRHIKRVIMYREIGEENINFVGDEVILTIPDDVRIRISCHSDGWRIVQCYSTH